MSLWSDLEKAVVDRLKEKIPTVANIRAAASDEVITVSSFPAIFVLFSNFDRESTETRTNPMIIRGSARVNVLAYSQSGGAPGEARLISLGGYELLEKVREALLGWVPALPNSPAFPMVLESEELNDIEGGAVAMISSYSVGVQVKQIT